jgi:hypothetical protein
MHILIGIAALVALLLLIRTLYYATLLMRPQVQVLRAERRAERLYAKALAAKQPEQRRYGFWEPGPTAAIVAICIILLATFGPLLVIAGH